ncbi:hypothetical protein PYW08_007285 [Mythimna loreyi]|uniref:Uncharacterized protein n=1 Tax=Mythimna loreyi TaxID=667449 RepID=A0ACC2RBB7_9NEOP|nr:hypothetical protein PYW08_007285 [Mythimna loreyi]
MWRVGVLLVATTLIEFSAADVKPADGLLVQRLKRSPHSCDSYDDWGPRRPRYWPPPPGPPPRYWPPPPGPPPYWPPPPQHRHRFEELADDVSRGEEPCAKCGEGNGVSSSISNAKSENGDAIAVAVAKASPKASPK